MDLKLLMNLSENIFMKVLSVRVLLSPHIHKKTFTVAAVGFLEELNRWTITLLMSML